jgi:hypothetical protein
MAASLYLESVCRKQRRVVIFLFQGFHYLVHTIATGHFYGNDKIATIERLLHFYLSLNYD